MQERNAARTIFPAAGTNPDWRSTGRVTKSVGFLVESEGPFCSVGENCEIMDVGREGASGARWSGFAGKTVLSMPFESAERNSIRRPCGGARRAASAAGGRGLLGRVIDATGQPLDSLGHYRAPDFRPLYGLPPQPLDRTPIHEPIGCGIRAIDGMLTCGRGQRMGIFGGSGVGKSTLVGMMARGTSADLTVVALVGERGREVREFLEDSLGEEGTQASVVVVATSDQSPLLRLRAALVATTVAEYFASREAACAAGGRFADAIRHGAARNRTGGGRAADGERLHAVGIFAAGATGGTCRAFWRREHHCVLQLVDGRRRSAGSAGGCGARAARRPHRARPPADFAEPLPADFHSR